VAMLIAACGSSKPASVDSQTVGTPSVSVDSNSQTTANADACALFTKADAEMALGQPVGDAQRPDQAGANDTIVTCRYKVQSENSYASAMLLVLVPLDGKVDSAKTHFAADKAMSQSMLAMAPVEIPGLGDEAYWLGGSVNQLTILHGNMRLILNVTTQTGDTVPQTMLDLGKMMLGRL